MTGHNSVPIILTGGGMIRDYLGLMSMTNYYKGERSSGSRFGWKRSPESSNVVIKLMIIQSVFTIFPL